MSVEDQYSDVLQNIESAIVTVYEENPRLLDCDVTDALDALIRGYGLEEQGRVAQEPRLSAPSRRIYDLSRSMCEWRLGRQPLNDDDPTDSHLPADELSTAELVLCLKRIRKSVKLWNTQGGRQGYLNFVRQFLGDAARGFGA